RSRRKDFGIVGAIAAELDPALLTLPGAAESLAAANRYEVEVVNAMISADQKTLHRPALRAPVRNDALLPPLDVAAPNNHKEHRDSIPPLRVPSPTAPDR